MKQAITKMGKEHFLSVMFLLGAFSCSWSQTQGFKMGLALEPNMAWMNSRDYEHITDGVRGHFGYQFMADIMFSETYAIGTGLHVFRTGSQVEYWEQTSQDSLSKVSRDFNNQYVELPLTFKMRTKEIGYSTYFGRFGAGLGLNTRREVDESRYVGYQRTDGWQPVDNPSIPAPDLEAGDHTKLFRASMIVGLGVERRIAGNSSLVVGVTYNSALFNTHKNVEVVKVDAAGVPRGLAEDNVLVAEMKGQDSILALSVGVVF
ncbi:PorT family protein [Flavobacteriales bacterium]|nr:PorT family protein [Flavobacteriales bacterium]